MVTISLDNLAGLAAGAALVVILLTGGHYFFQEHLSRVQAYTYGTLVLIAGFVVWALGTNALASAMAFLLLAGVGGVATISFYWLDKRFGWKEFPNTTPVAEELYQLKGRNLELEKALADSQAECERLKGMPLAVAEWQRQEAVAALSNSLEIIQELTGKLGIAYGNVSSIKGVFQTKGALNMSAKTQRELAKQEGRN